MAVGLFALLSAFFSSTWNDREVVVTSSDGRLPTRVLVGGIVDPIYRIQVQPTDPGLLSKVIDVGCITGDAHHLQPLRWEGPDLVADPSAGSIAITVPTSDDDRPAVA